MKTDKADKWFSIYIRLRDSDDKGYCKCITCNNVLFWKSMDCGHFIKRQHQAVRFSEVNCHAQDKNCNWLKQGNDAEYEKAIIEKYGKQTLYELKASEFKTLKRSQAELDILAKYFQKKAVALAKEKGLTI